MDMVDMNTVFSSQRKAPGTVGPVITREPRVRSNSGAVRLLIRFS